MAELECTYSPAEAAEHFGFAPSLLRRYAGIYEAAGGTIPHDKRGGRLYSHGLLEHFSSARERVMAGETVEFDRSTQPPQLGAVRRAAFQSLSFQAFAYPHGSFRRSRRDLECRTSGQVGRKQRRSSAV